LRDVTNSVPNGTIGVKVGWGVESKIHVRHPSNSYVSSLHLGSNDVVRMTVLTLYGHLLHWKPNAIDITLFKSADAYASNLSPAHRVFLAARDTLPWARSTSRQLTMPVVYKIATFSCLFVDLSMVIWGREMMSTLSAVVRMRISALVHTWANSRKWKEVRK
jgi:hypothetical protein